MSCIRCKIKQAANRANFGSKSCISRVKTGCVAVGVGIELRQMSKSRKFAAYPRLNPLGVGKNISAADLVDQTFLAYNGGRLREAAKLLVEKMLPNDGFIGMSITGAITAAGRGKSCIIPLTTAG